MTRMVKSAYWACARRLIIILVILTIIFVAIVNIKFNMTGYWLVPAPVSSAFEGAKSILRNKVTYKAKKQITKQNRTLINVIEGVRNKDEQGLNKDKVVNMTDSVTNRNIWILWFNKPIWINLNFANRVLTSECVYSNCKMTDDTKNIQKNAAIVFSVTQQLDFTPPISYNERNSDQVWIFFGLESPLNHKNIAYRHNSWMNTMNWSMSYRLDADIFFPYGMLEKRKEISVRNYSAVFHRKTKQAAWLVSNCGAPSKRDKFVSELQRNGIKVDVFGICTNNIFHERDSITAIINKDYKFYLSLENSLCNDYVTEKFFRYYNLDVILLVRGGADYDHALPNETFINSAHFDSLKSLANFLLKVSSSEKLYTEYLRKKDRYVASEMFTMPSSYCSICEKLNNLNENRKTYEDHISYIHENMCWGASDVTLTLRFKFVIIVTISLLLVLVIKKFARRYIR